MSTVRMDTVRLSENDGLFLHKNAQGRRNLSFYLHLPKFVCVKAVYPSDYKIFLSSFVKFVFVIG